MSYFDYSAHTPADPRVLARFCEVAREYPGNANSPHAEGARAKALLEESVAQIAAFFGAKPDEVVMTSGATEANNLAVKGALRMRRHAGKRAVATCLEHSSVTAPLSQLQNEGWSVDIVGLARDGTVDLDQLQDALTPETTLVSVLLADGELGAVQPVAAISALVRRLPNCLLHVDATQAVGKIPVSFEGVDLMSFSAHKFYGLSGVGALLIRDGVVLEPLLAGGRGQSAYRAGTPPLELTAATAEALRLAEGERGERNARVADLNRELRAAVAGMPGVLVNSPETALPHSVNLSIPGLKAAETVERFDRAGICLSAKSACSVPGTPSRAVMELYKDRKRALSSIRIGLSHLTTDGEVQALINTLREISAWNARAQ